MLWKERYKSLIFSTISLVTGRKGRAPSLIHISFESNIFLYILIVISSTFLLILCYMRRTWRRLIVGEFVLELIYQGGLLGWIDIVKT